MNILRKPVITVLVLLALLLPAVSILPALTGRAAAAAPPDCTYTYSSDKSTITTSDCEVTSTFSPVSGITLSQSKSDKKVYTAKRAASSTTSCTVTISAKSSGSADATISGQLPQATGGGICIDVDKTAINIVGGTSDDSDSDSGSDSGETCDPDKEACGAEDIDNCTSYGDPLGWFVCAVIDSMTVATKGMESIINSLLKVDMTAVFAKNSNETARAYYNTWNTFRIFGVVLIIIAGLVMIIAQALGFEIFDAYTIRKIMPRLLIAAIAISISWYLLEFLCNLTNDLGQGIRTIIYYPFRNISASGSGLTTGAELVGDLALGAAGLALGVGGLLSLIATAALAAFVAFAVLIIRQLVITFLILIAPFAIALYVFPNTEKWYKLWWDSLSKGLLMFPIIMGIIAIGHVFALTAYANNGGAGATINSIVGLMAYFLPYFLLPFTFRLAGGAVATLAGLANDRSRGAFDRLKNYRANKTADNWRRIKENERFNPNANGKLGAWNKRVNSILSNAADPVSTAKIYGGKTIRGVSGGRYGGSVGMGALNQVEEARFQATQKASEYINNKGFNAEALRAIMGMETVNAQTIRRTADAMLADPNADENTILGANQLRSYGTSLATAMYKDPEMGRASIQAAAGLALSAQGFADSQDIAKLGDNLGGSTSGFANNVVAMAQLASMRAGRSDFKPGYSIRPGADGKFEGTTSSEIRFDSGDKTSGVPRLDPAELARVQAAQVQRISGMNSGQLEADKPQTIKALAEGYEHILSSEAGQEYAAPSADGRREIRYNISDVDQQRVINDFAKMFSPYTRASADHQKAVLKIMEGEGIKPELKAQFDKQREAYERESITASGEAAHRSEEGGGGEEHH